MFAGVSSTTRMRALVFVAESFKSNTSISGRLVQQGLCLGEGVVIDVLLELCKCGSVEHGLKLGEIGGQTICGSGIELAQISGHSRHRFANHLWVNCGLHRKWCLRAGR